MLFLDFFKYDDFLKSSPSEETPYLFGWNTSPNQTDMRPSKTSELLWLLEGSCDDAKTLYHLSVLCWRFSVGRLMGLCTRTLSAGPTAWVTVPRHHLLYWSCAWTTCFSYCVHGPYLSALARRQATQLKLIITSSQTQAARRPKRRGVPTALLCWGQLGTAVLLPKTVTSSLQAVRV